MSFLPGPTQPYPPLKAVVERDSEEASAFSLADGTSENEGRQKKV